MQGIKEQLSSSEQREAMIPNHVIIFGVSIPKYSKEYLSDHEFNYHIVAQPGAQIRDIASDIRKYSTTDFDKSCVAGVVLDIGSNSLLSNQTFDQNMEDFQDMLSAAMVTFPQAEVLVSGILSRFDDEVLDRAAETYNIHFAQQCKRFGDRVKFVDLRNHFMSGRLSRFARKLQEAVEYHLSTDPEHVRWKQAFSTAVQKVGLPKPFHQGPPSPENINRNPPSQRKVKPNYHRPDAKAPQQDAHLEGKRIPQTSVAEKMLRDDSNNARRGKKRKIRHEHTEKDPNPRDLDMLDQLLSMVQDQRSGQVVYLRMFDSRLLTVEVVKDSGATSHTFGGMRKGFLFGGATKKKTEVAETVKAPGKTEASEAGSADGSPEYLKRHMTQWTSSEVQDWLQTVGRLRSNEVKPFVAEKMLPEETSRLYKVTDIKLSPETVTNIRDKKSTSLSSKEAMLNPISNVDSSMLARIQNRTNVVLVENSLLTDERNKLKRIH
ncbi:hypothetical protein Bbelb_147200 [Branchiostoma belcheri]|nr:hypothetical protein Bbelb_147200 [Branchiostoma belcheri]